MNISTYTNLIRRILKLKKKKKLTNIQTHTKQWSLKTFYSLNLLPLEMTHDRAMIEIVSLEDDKNLNLLTC